MHPRHVVGLAGTDEVATLVAGNPTYVVTVYNRGDYVGGALVWYDLNGSRIRYPTGYISPGSQGEAKVASGATNVKAEFYVKNSGQGPDTLVTA
jgi:hypothetical protein